MQNLGVGNWGFCITVLCALPRCLHGTSIQKFRDASPRSLRGLLFLLDWAVFDRFEPVFLLLPSTWMSDEFDLYIYCASHSIWHVSMQFTLYAHMIHYYITYPSIDTLFFLIFYRYNFNKIHDILKWPECKN